MGILRTSLIALVAVLAGCAVESTDDAAEPITGTVQQAITHGDTDTDDKAVVALMLGGQAFCSGTLISPYVVVTAAHCVTPQKPDQIYFGNTPKTTGSGTLITVAEAHFNPDFDADELQNDIAIVALAEAAPVRPKAWATSDDVSNDDFDNLDLRIVGFGATKSEADFTPKKREGTTTITTVGNNTFKFDPSPSQTCNGDSGGAAFATVNGKEMLVGVTSAGDEGCSQYGRDMRIDAYEDFINGKMKAYSAVIQNQQAAAAAASCSFSPNGTHGSSGAGAALVALGLIAIARRKRA